MFQLFSRGNGLRSYRNRIRNHLQHTSSIRLLPQLLDLPLIAGGNGEFRPAGLFDQPNLMALCGPPGSGRSLALFQAAWQWAGSNRPEALLYFSLADVDALNLSPRAVLTNLLHQSGQPSPLDQSDPQARRWILLIDHWDRLPAPRQAAWQSFLQALPATWHRLQLIISLPRHQHWPAFSIQTLPSPDEGRLRRWLAHLLPQHPQPALLAALQAGGPLAPLRRSLGDIALLALTYPTYGLPGNRSQLYARAEAMYDALPTLDEADISISNPLQFADDSRRARYRLAQAIAAGQQFDRLGTLDESELADVAPLLVAQLTDPGQLYAQIWPLETPAIHLPSLAACLSERPAARPDWGLRILAGLLARQEQAGYQHLLPELQPHIPIILAAADSQGYAAQVGSLLRPLAPLLGAHRLINLLDTAELSSDIRWTTADVLVNLREALPPEELYAQPALDTLSQAARAYLLALGPPRDHQRLLIEPGRTWFKQLNDCLNAPERRSTIARTLLFNPELPAEFLADILPWLDRHTAQAIRPQLAATAVHPDPGLRHAALQVMQRHDPDAMLPFIKSRLADAAHPWEVRRDLLPMLAELPQPAALAMLTHSCINEQIPLAGRLTALSLISRRRNVGALLQRIALHQQSHPVVQALALHRLIRIAPGRPSLALLRSIARMALARSETPHELAPVLQSTAIHCLAELQPNRTVLGCLVYLLEQPLDDVAAIADVIAALERHADPAALPALQRFLHSDLLVARRDYWQSQTARLAALPINDWPSSELPAPARRQIEQALSTGETGADSPSMLAELIEQEQHTLLLAAARALAAIAARHDARVRRLVRVSLLKVLRRPYPAQLLRQLLECLGQAGNDGGLHDFGQILGDPHASTQLRWLAVEQLAALIERDSVAPAIVALLLRYLDQENADPLSRATAAQALGRSGFALTLPVLQQLAGQSGADEHLRAAAIRGLGALTRSGNRDTRRQAECSLRNLITDTGLPARLRAIAATSLPDECATETRSMLHELLSRQRQEPVLAAALLQALGRNQDRTALTIILRYCQSELAAEALAAIEALLALGDPSTTSTLVRITLNTNLTQPVRLTAVGALLRLGGVEYLPLLRGYLHDAPLPLRLQALEYLLAVFPTDQHAVLLANDPSAPRMLRLRAIEALTSQSESWATLTGLAANAQNENAVRLAALQRLAAITDQSAAAETCEQIVRETGTHWQLRRHAIAALRTLARKPPLADAATAALTRLSDNPDLAITIRCWAAQSLIENYSGEQNG